MEELVPPLALGPQDIAHRRRAQQELARALFRYINSLENLQSYLGILEALHFFQSLFLNHYKLSRLYGYKCAMCEYSSHLFFYYPTFPAKPDQCVTFPVTCTLSLSRPKDCTALLCYENSLLKVSWRPRLRTKLWKMNRGSVQQFIR